MSPFEIEDEHFYFAHGNEWIGSWKDIMDCKEWRYPFSSISFPPFRRTVVNIIKQHERDSSLYLVQLAPLSSVIFSKPLFLDVSFSSYNHINNNNNNNNNLINQNNYENTEWMNREELIECINGIEVYERFISVSSSFHN